MTTEVAILNKRGVALAADSRVTGDRTSKAFDTAEKIFEISDAGPVAMMVYGSSDFMGVPLATVASDFRRAEAGRKPKLDDWLDAFVRFLHTYGPFDDDDRRTNMKSVVSSTLERFCYETTASLARAGIRRGTRTATREFLSRTSRATAIARGTARMDDYTRVSLGREYRATIDEALAHQTVPHGEDVVAALRCYVLAKLADGRSASPDATGFVIAGFGADQLLPTVVAFETDGWLGDTLKIVRETDNDVEIGAGEGGAIMPFAQTAMIRRHMLGVDPDLQTFLSEATDRAVRHACAATYHKYNRAGGACGPRDRRQLEGIVSQAMKHWRDEYFEERHRRFEKPITDVMGLLTSAEMARFARGLVESTILDQRYSTRFEGVGGPVKVLLLTRKDGFSWMGEVGNEIPPTTRG